MISDSSFSKPASPAFQFRGLFANLVEIEHQIQLAHIPKELVKDLHKEVYGLQVRQLIVVGVYTDAEEEACIASIDDLG